MNFLFFRAKKSIYDFPWVLIEMRHNVKIIETYEYDPLEDNPEGYAEIERELLAEPYDFLISYIFFPKAAEICHKLQIPYISWTYDSPLVSLFCREVLYPTNYLFIFDRSEYEHLKVYDIPHLYYLPMAANLSRTGALEITSEDEQKYTCDISFIGSMYEGNSYNSIIQFFPEHLGLELKTWLMKNLCNWNDVKPWPEVSPAIVDFMCANLGADGWNTYDMSNSLYFGMLVLTRKLAEMDRITVLNTIAQDYPVHLYTHSTSPLLQNVVVHRGVDYYTDMNKIFYLSKINLNITLPSIETGLPQRIFDIMGCGGFVLTNYQKEIDDLFEIGTDIEVFHNLAELQEKIKYYLSHERERLTIAINGYKKIRDRHTYQHRITEMLQIVQEDLR